MGADQRSRCVRTRCMWASQISTASVDARRLSPLCNLMLSARTDEDCVTAQHRLKASSQCRMDPKGQLSPCARLIDWGEPSTP
jgi:hypothetical protein